MSRRKQCSVQTFDVLKRKHDLHVGQMQVSVRAPPVDRAHVLRPRERRHCDGPTKGKHWQTVREAPVHPGLSSELDRPQSSVERHKAAGQKCLQQVVSGSEARHEEVSAGFGVSERHIQTVCGFAVSVRREDLVDSLTQSVHKVKARSDGS